MEKNTDSSSQQVEIHILTPEELALKSTPFNGDLEKFKQDVAKRIKEIYAKINN